MDTVKVDRSKLMQKYQKGDKKFRDELIDLCGVEAFYFISPETRKRFEEACKEQGVNPDDILHKGPNLHIEQVVANAYTMQRILAKSKRGTWEPDWTDGTWKYTPWPRYEPGVGFVVDRSLYVNARTFTGVGSRLCFPTSQMAIEFGQENIDLYRITHSN